MITEKIENVLIKVLQLLKLLLYGELGTKMALQTAAISRFKGLLEHTNIYVLFKNSMEYSDESLRKKQP